MQGFVDSFLTTLGAYLPSVLGALLIFVVGWLFAVAVKKCVAGILGRIGLDDRISDKSHEPLQVEKLLTGLVYYLTGAVKEDVAFLGSPNFVYHLSLYRFLRVQRDDLWSAPIAAVA